MEFVIEYGLFLAKVATLVVALGVVLVLLVSARRRGGGEEGRLEVQPLNRRLEKLEASLKQGVMTRKQFKREMKQYKARHKREDKTGSDRPRLFVLNFRGDIRASAVSSLREEITAVLMLAADGDEVLVRLENAGGLVHEHGLAASQLQRLKTRGIRVTVAVDKVAASGGYMMACVADHIVAAPFAVLGSIGVLAQIPNFHRLLDSHGVEYEMIKAGELKRTLTMFGKNTAEDRARLQEQIEDTHLLFKDFVAGHRPALDMAQVATGEHWHGLRALERNLVDELCTSDDYLLRLRDSADLYELAYKRRKDLGQRLAGFLQRVADGALVALATRLQEERVAR